MRLGIIDLLVAGFDIPNTPRAMIFISGAKALIASSKRTWSLPFPVSLADGVRALRLGNFHQALPISGRAKLVPSRYLFS